MKPKLPEINMTSSLYSPEYLLKIIAVLSYHLAVELDLHYEDDDANNLEDEVEALETASATLFAHGMLAPGPVHHSIERFML